MPDYREEDSDDDSIPDSVEAGNDPTDPADTDGDNVPDYREEDSDNDGLLDELEAGDDPTDPTDTDGDNVPDYREEDSDNCLLYTSPSPRDRTRSRMPSSA